MVLLITNNRPNEDNDDEEINCVEANGCAGIGCEGDHNGDDVGEKCMLTAALLTSIVEVSNVLRGRRSFWNRLQIRVGKGERTRCGLRGWR